MVDYGKNNLKIDLRQGTLETVNLDSKFDLIIMIQVIAHLFDLNRSLKNASDFLKPGGYVLIETWNRRSLSNHVKSLLMHKMGETRSLRKISGIVGLIPDNIFLPYPAEDLFWVLYRKNQ